jgi:uncharacterized glyoxalase superfamily protein PhnB
MLLVTPNFHFSGNGEEAINLYEKAFNTKVDFLLKYTNRR